MLPLEHRANLMVSISVFTTYGRTPWTKDQPVARPVPTQDHTTEGDQGQTSMPYAGFEFVITRILKEVVAAYSKLLSLHLPKRYKH
jgi:hypothetical protein